MKQFPSNMAQDRNLRAWIVRGCPSKPGWHRLGPTGAEMEILGFVSGCVSSPTLPWMYCLRLRLKTWLRQLRPNIAQNVHLRDRTVQRIFAIWPRTYCVGLPLKTWSAPSGPNRYRNGNLGVLALQLFFPICPCIYRVKLRLKSWLRQLRPTIA